jgi:hypothetical protein
MALDFLPAILILGTLIIFGASSLPILFRELIFYYHSRWDFSQESSNLVFMQKSMRATFWFIKIGYLKLSILACQTIMFMTSLSTILKIGIKFYTNH